MESEAAGGPNTPSRLRQPKQRKSAFTTPLVAQQMAAAILERSASIPDVSLLDIAPSGDDGAGGEGEVREGQRPRLKSPRLQAKEQLHAKEQLQPEQPHPEQPQQKVQQKAQQKAQPPPTLPKAIPNGPGGGGDRLVTTYKSALSATGRPVLVTRMMPRSMSKSSVGSQRSTLHIPPPYGGGVVYETGIRKGRLEEMERMMDELKNRMESSTQSTQGIQDRLDGALRTVAALEEERRHLQDQLASKGRAADEAGEEASKVRRLFEAARAEWEGESAQSRSRMQAALDRANEERSDLERRCKGLKSELSDCADEIAALKARASSQSNSLVDSDAQIRALKAHVALLEGTCADRSVQIGSVEAQLAEARGLLVVASEKLQVGEALRRKLHNTVQELKGNIRVFCRVRPLSAAEVAAAPNKESPMEHMTVVSSGECGDSLEEIRLLQQVESSSGSVAKPSVFSFDKVFPGDASQGAVFDEISQLVQSALDGYRVCIFAYGQTGSGKTFTMEGDASDPTRKGMIPRAVEQIFESTKLLGERGWAFSFEASYLEIYNETIRDLLAVKGPAAGAGSGVEPKYDIKHVDGSTHVTDQVVVPVSQPREIMTLLSRAASNRAVAETQCNERSSRSHSVFSLKITGENGLTGEKIGGLLNLIDLAGSERLSQSGSTGDRLRETQAINKSLSSLGDVIHSLANKEAHIPYRNSKLTYLLQNSLGGNSKTLMFVNVSPAAANVGESICSLRFATKVNACHIGTATRKVGK